SDEGAVLDARRVLGPPVVIDGHGPGADVDAPADLRVAQVAVMGHLAAGPHPGILPFRKVAHPRAVFQHGARPQVVEGAHGDAVTQAAFLDHRRADGAAVADAAVVDLGARADAAAAAHHGAAG